MSVEVAEAVIRLVATIALSITMRPVRRPRTVTGMMSPYPTVVRVWSTHHMESSYVLTAGLTGNSTKKNIMVNNNREEMNRLKP